jgi:subtilisin family serine protease
MPTYEVYLNSYYGMNQNYDYAGGTSNSCPYVAGLAGLILSNDPTLTPDEVKSIICKYSEPYNSIYYLGRGRINAYRAIEKVKSIDYINPWLFILIQRCSIFEKILSQIIL